MPHRSEVTPPQIKKTTVIQNYARVHWSVHAGSIWENIEHSCDAEILKEISDVQYIYIMP